MPTRSFIGVEIARVGRNFPASTGPVTFTTADFDEAERAYNALHQVHHAPIKLGHDEQQALLQEDGMPNAGFLENIRRRGDRLMADLVNVPETIAALIDQGRYRARSIEAFRNMEVDGRRWPFVVTGLALLGADLPAVDGLKDIVQLYTSKGLEVPSTKDSEVQVVLLLSHVDDADQLRDDLERLLPRIQAVISGPGDSPNVRALAQAAADGLRSINQARPAPKKENDMELPRLLEILGLPLDTTEEIALAKLGEMKASVTPSPTPEPVPSPAPEPQPDPVLSARMGELQQELITLKTARARDLAIQAVDQAIKAGKFVPAVRDDLVEFALAAPAQFEKLSQATPRHTILASTKELGNDGDGHGDNEELEPTAQELMIAARMGNTREDIIAQKALTSGRPVPPAVAETLAARRGR